MVHLAGSIHLMADASMRQLLSSANVALLVDTWLGALGTDLPPPTHVRAHLATWASMQAGSELPVQPPTLTSSAGAGDRGGSTPLTPESAKEFLSHVTAKVDELKATLSEPVSLRALQCRLIATVSATCNEAAAGTAPGARGGRRAVSNVEKFGAGLESPVLNTAEQPSFFELGSGSAPSVTTWLSTVELPRLADFGCAPPAISSHRT